MASRIQLIVDIPGALTSFRSHRPQARQPFLNQGQPHFQSADLGQLLGQRLGRQVQRLAA